MRVSLIKICEYYNFQIIPISNLAVLKKKINVVMLLFMLQGTQVVTTFFLNKQITTNEKQNECSPF